MTKEELIKKAREARALAYVPYSKFKVGAALLTKSGKVYVGANVENASYGLCNCAERNALFHAMMNGEKKEDFVALAVTGKTAGPISPCGACRQVMSELLPKDAPIYLTNLEDAFLETTIAELLPFAFDDSDL
ncbi:MAG: cytidine deaminase [Bacilli bacterium]|nr:cytidine deaminase [Bacillota bacterium]NLI51887.1 cytidine deaminase [Erysipelotrichaceae bacterium]OQC50638.1 MAG: Cytidine deaminase [Tenericutes bacterium ADurb.Bin024]HOA10942.1 cytidine deaminase [Bacilli bacterium]TAH59177.1 MAG: cytidine deaminase [Bacillota bacterium]